jgi:hypothetical protein
MKKDVSIQYATLKAGSHVTKALKRKVVKEIQEKYQKKLEFYQQLDETE